MYEKFKIDIYYYNRKYYYLNNELYLEKKWISSYLYHPVIRKLLFYKFNFVRISHFGEQKIEKVGDDGTFEIAHYWNKNDDFAENKKLLKTAKPNKEILLELEKYCPDIEKQRGYFFSEVYHKNIKMPDYYGLLYLGDYCSFQNCSINIQNYISFLHAIKEDITELMVFRVLSPNALDNHFVMLHYLGDVMNDYLDSIRLNKKDEYPLNIEDFRKYQKRISEITDIGLKRYISNIVDEFIDYVIENKDGLRCQHCGLLIEYAPTKKYCSFNTDGQDCGKKARNARTYQRAKQKS